MFGAVVLTDSKSNCESVDDFFNVVGLLASGEFVPLMFTETTAGFDKLDVEISYLLVTF